MVMSKKRITEAANPESRGIRILEMRSDKSPRRTWAIFPVLYLELYPSMALLRLRQRCICLGSSLRCIERRVNQTSLPARPLNTAWAGLTCVLCASRLLCATRDRGSRRRVRRSSPSRGEARAVSRYEQLVELRGRQTLPCACARDPAASHTGGADAGAAQTDGILTRWLNSARCFTCKRGQERRARGSAHGALSAPVRGSLRPGCTSDGQDHARPRPRTSAYLRLQAHSLHKT